MKQKIAAALIFLVGYVVGVAAVIGYATLELRIGDPLFGVGTLNAAMSYTLIWAVLYAPAAIAGAVAATVACNKNSSTRYWMAGYLVLLLLTIFLSFIYDRIHPPLLIQWAVFIIVAVIISYCLRRTTAARSTASSSLPQ